MEKQLSEYRSKLLLDTNFIVRIDFSVYDKLSKEKKLKIRRFGEDLWLVSDEQYTIAELHKFAEQMAPRKKQ